MIQSVNTRGLRHGLTLHLGGKKLSGSMGGAIQACRGIPGKVWDEVSGR